MKKLLLIFLLSSFCFASKFGAVQIESEDGSNIAHVEADSSLRVYVPGMSFNGDSALKVVLPGHICDINTTDSLLGISGTFLGGWENVLNYAAMTVLAYSNKASATNGLEVQWSADSITIHTCDEFTIPASTGKVFTFSPPSKYARIKYTNGATAQDTFQIQTILKRTNIQSSSHRIHDSIVGDDDAVLVKSVLTGHDQNEVFQNIRSSEIGAMWTVNFLVEVSRGNLPGYSLDRKFGSIASIQAATPADVWAYGITSGAETYTFSDTGTADIDRISSDNNSDVYDITVVGLDQNGYEVVQTVTLTGFTPVPLDSSLWRVNRAFNANGVDLLGNVYVFVNGATTNGVPDDVADVRAYIPIGEGQTLQTIYTVPRGKTAYFMGLETSLTKAGGATVVGGQFRGRTREYGKVFRTRDDFDLLSSGNSNRVVNLPISLPFPERTDFVANVNVTANGAGATWAFSVLLIDN